MDARDADPFEQTVQLNLQPAACAERQIVLGYLVDLHQVRVGVVLAVELGLLRHLAVEGESGHDGHLHRPLVDGGENAGHTQAYGADVGVGRRIGVGGGAGTEHLAACKQLSVDLQSNDCFISNHGGLGLRELDNSAPIADNCRGWKRLHQREERT